MKLRSMIVVSLIATCLMLATITGALAQNLSLQATSDGNTPATSFPRGEALYLNIVVDNAAMLAGCAFTLNYPADKLTAPATNADGTPVDPNEITSIFPFSYQTTPTHRENSSEPGKIYLSGAAIDTDGGAKYDSGEVVLFTIKFTVRMDAPETIFNLSLTQTELCNLAAGYGIDNNTNGVCDEGDGMSPVPVLVGAVGQGEPGFDTFDCSNYPTTPCAFPTLLGDTAHPFTTVTSSPLDVDPAPQYLVNGTVSYSGRQVGTLYVAAFAPSDTNFTTPIGGQSYAWDSGTTSKAFSLSVENGSYYLGAYIDSNTNATRDAPEAQGAYTSQVIAISGANDATPRNFAIVDPDANSDGMPDYWVALYSVVGGAGDDDDQDGYSNLVEFQNDTNPNAQDPAYAYANYDPATDNRGPYQIVSTSPTSIRKGAGKAFSFAVNYNTSDDNPNLSGLGLRIHYDSSKLTWNNFTEVLALNQTVLGSSPQDDTGDADNDPSTDKFLVVAWSDNGSTWPGSLPVQLFKMEFTIDSGLADGETTSIRFSSSSTAANYSLFADPLGVTVAPFNLDVDGNGVPDALTDGLLIMRYLFDARGSDLIANAFDPFNGTRITAPEIEAYIADGLSSIDIDGNGVPDALTDGLLIMRYLFDARGSDLINNAFDPFNGTRITAPEIETYITGLLP